MMKEILTEEKVKQRWQQMEEMNAIWDCLTERQKGYLDGCMNTVIALKIGTYSVMIRMKISDTTKTDSVISVKIRKGSSTGDVIKEIRISPSMFDGNNKYKILGTIVDFGEVKKGTKMHIEASILKTTIMETVTIDYMLVNPAYTSVSAV